MTVSVTVKVVAERSVAGTRLMVYIGVDEARLELSGILWTSHETSAEVVRRLEGKPDPPPGA